MDGAQLMSWRDLEDYNYSIINEDSDEAVAFFLLENDAQKFCDMKNKDIDEGHLSYRIGEYLDVTNNIQIMGS